MSNKYYRISKSEYYFDSNGNIIGHLTKYDYDLGYFTKLDRAIEYLKKRKKELDKGGKSTELTFGGYSIGALLAVNVKYEVKDACYSYSIDQYALHEFEFEDESDDSFYDED